MKDSRTKRHRIPSALDGGGVSRSQGGFSLIELAVTMVAFSAVMIVAFGIMAQLNRAGLNSELMARTQAAARAASEQIEKELRAAGVDADFSRGQPRFVYADAYQIAFNANLNPTVDPDGSAAPAAVHTGSVPQALSVLWNPPLTYNTGAETIVYTLDSGADGQIDSTDEADDQQEINENPRDMVLYRRVFGWDGSANTMDERQIALLRGPEPNSEGEYPPPLFAYLIDDDDNRITPPVLHGDTDGDGKLSNSEIAQLQPLTQAERARIERVIVTVTSETERPDEHTPENDGFQRVTLRSEVLVRHTPRTSGVVYGKVFQDTDGDQVQDPEEGGIAGVVIRSSSGVQVQTDTNGGYRMVLTPGYQTITEVDPAGYMSSTPNTINLDVIPGSYERILFGDRSPSGSATVQGVVFNDLNQNGIQDPDEDGVQGVTIYSDGGEQTVTDENGAYTLTVPVGNRTISETDLDGYTSTTANSVDVVLSRDGQVETVHFGDYLMEDSGTIDGYVYNDENYNQVRDGDEEGVAGAMIYAAGDSAQTDFSGHYSLTVPAGQYDVVEVDPPGYSSTTPNRYHGIQVDPDATVQLDFGDVVQEDVNFDVITLADTERALSLTSGDMGEDNRGDPDLVLGTHSSAGTNNLMVWHNARRNAHTPNGALFDSDPTATRNAGSDVMTMGLVETSDDPYLVLGLRVAGAPDLSVWEFNRGLPGNAPDYWFSTVGGEAVLDLQVINYYGDSGGDLVLGTATTSSGGSVELWNNLGGGQFEHIDGGTITVGAGDLGISLGEVDAIAMADVNGDGLDDLVAGSRQSPGLSMVSVYLRLPVPLGVHYESFQAFPVQGDITDLHVLDMIDDDQGLPDIVVACENTDEVSGHIELWLQHEDGRFGIANGNDRVFDDYMETHGAPLVFYTERVDNDIFPDLLIGTRVSNLYQGMVELALGFGYLPSQPTLITENPIGAVVTMTLNDFNLDNGTDLAVGTQNSATMGQVVIFYRQ